MSVENIKKTIIRDAEKEAEEMVAATAGVCEERLEKGRHGIESEMDRRFEKTKKELVDDAERRVMQKRSKHNIELLARRNEILNRAFDLAARRLENLEGDGYRQLIGEWLDQIPEEVPGEAICHSGDIERIKPLIEEINKSRAGDSEITLVSDDEVESGIVFRSESFEIDLTVCTRLNELREELTPEVAGMIFSKNVTI